MQPSPDALALLVIALAAFRLTRFLVRDSLMGFGPESGSRMSVRVDAFAYDPEGLDRSYLRGKVGDLATCNWCLGFHVSWVLLCAWYQLAPWELGVQGWTVAFAIAGVQGFIASRMNA